MKCFLRKYVFDILVILIFSPFIFIVLTLISFFLMLFEGRPIIFKSQRVGANQKLFTIYKFRTMAIDAPIIETDMMDNQSIYVTKLGHFLRMTSLDELPQIFNVIVGQMSLVGPRPALPSQLDLNKSRLDMEISFYKPGITGLAQIKGRDTLSLNDKLGYDRLYCYKQNLRYDMCIIISTVIKVLRRSNISH